MDNHKETSQLLGSKLFCSLPDISDDEGLIEDGIIKYEYEEKFEPTIYKRRWWILMVFSLFAIAEGLIWNSLTPLSNAAQISLGWSVETIAALPMLSSVVTVIFVIPLSYLLQVKGLRVAVIIGSSAMAIQGILWVIAAHTEQVWLFVIGTVGTGLAVCTSMTAGAYVSALWFPVTQRTTATAIAAISPFLGNGLPYITGPNIVGLPVTPAQVRSRNVTADYISILKAGIIDTIYLDAAVATVTLILVLAYFPRKPPKPPSRTQTIERAEFKKGLKLLFRNTQYWMLIIAYGVVCGSFTSWLPLSAVNLRSLNVTEARAGWIAFAAMMSGAIGSVCISMVADGFKKQTKTFLKIMTVSAAILYIVLACIQQHYILVTHTYITGLLFGLYIALSLCINGAIPLYYELACEYAYPVHEAVACTLLVLVNCLCNALFFGLYFIPALSKDSAWMTWTCVGACMICLPLLMALKDRYQRLDLDQMGSDDEPLAGAG